MSKIDFASSIPANKYQTAGIINTVELSELPKDFDKPFLLDPIEYNKEIKKVFLIYNPVSGKGIAKSLVNKYLIPKLKASKITVDVLVSECPRFITKYLIEQKQKLLSKNIDAFIIVGGDGTYNEFVNGYISGEWIKHNTPVLFCNAGTGNSLCLNVGINDEKEFKKLMDKVCTQIENKQAINVQYMDCIQICSVHSDDKKDNEVDEKECKQKDNHMLYVCSLTYWGLPGTAGKTAESLRMFGGYRYDIAAVYHMMRRDSRNVKLTLYFDDTESDTMTVDIDISVLVIMKNKYFGKGLMITPLAKLDSGLLDIAILTNVSRKEMLALFSVVPKGTHILETHPDKGPFYFRCKKVTLEPCECFEEIGCDGELGPKPPFTLKVLPKAVPMII